MTIPKDEAIARLRRDAKPLEPGLPFEVGPFRQGDGPGVAGLFLSIYGERYPVEDYYFPERVEAMNADGRVHSIVARLETGQVAGQGAFYRSSPPNQALYEFGQVMVAHEYRHSTIAARITREMDRFSRDMSHAQGFFGEAVCNHTVTQKLIARQGYRESGIEVALMPDGAFEGEGAGARRVSCVLAFRVDRDRPMALHLPGCYREEMGFLLDGFPLDREVIFHDADQPGAARSRIESRTFDFAGVRRVQVLEAGADFGELARAMDVQAKADRLAVLQAYVDAGRPGAAMAVNALRANGFFLGGLAPVWFGTDGILMQKLYVDPGFEDIQLLSERSKALLAFIRADRERALPLA